MGLPLHQLPPQPAQGGEGGGPGGPGGEGGGGGGGGCLAPDNDTAAALVQISPKVDRPTSPIRASLNIQSLSSLMFPRLS